MGELLASVRNAGEWLAAGTGRTPCEEVRSWPGRGMYPLPEQEQIEKYAEAFYGLSKLFLDLPCQKERLGDEDLETLFDQVKEKTCKDCGRASLCWEEHYFASCRMLYELFMELQYEGVFSKELQEEVNGYCARPERLSAAMKDAYEEARRNLLWSNRLMEQRQAVGEQIFQTAELLKKTASGFSGAPKREALIWKKLKREMKFLDISLLNLRVFVCDGDRLEIYLTLAARRRTYVSAKTIAEALSDCCGEKMRPAWNCRAAVSEEPANFHFVPDTRFQIFCGISKITKAGEMVSGDNYAFLQKDTGKVVMSLADGMGSGVGACKESEKVIELLEQFLDAGFPQETAVRMINSCMLLQNQQQMFSTIDLCMIDLYNAKCDMIKSGAAATFICQGDEIEVIQSNAFPAGVMQQSDYESMHRQLTSGSTIIMMTDGVLEALPQEHREERMVELIKKTETPNAREYAQRLMERIYLMQKLQARDDMTILIGNIWEK